MKIIISNRYFLRRNNIDWVYFGSTFSKQKECENKIKGNRIDISKETKKIFSINKLKLSGWVEDKKKKNSISSWLTHFSCRNNLVSKIFLNISQLMAVKSLIAKRNNNQNLMIVCEDTFLIFFLKKNLEKKIKTHISWINYIIHFFLIIFMFSKGVLKQLIILKRLIKLKIVSSILFKKNLELYPQGKIILFHTVLEDKINNFKCRYFKSLPNWFIKKKVGVVYKIPWFLNFNKVSTQLIKKLRLNNFIIFEDYLGFFDYLKIYKIFIESFKIFTKKKDYNSIKVSYLFQKESLLHLQEPVVFFLRAIPAIKKFTKNASLIHSYDHYENMPFEHSLRYALKIVNKKVLNIGYFHSLVSKNFFVYCHNKSEWDNNKIKPDYIICTGNLSKFFLIKNNIPRKKIIIGAALRQNPTTNYKNNKNNILILLPMELNSSNELLTKIYENRNKILYKVRFNKIIIKPHPLANISDILRKSYIYELPPNWEISKRSLNYDLQKSFCTISMSTASIYDSVLNSVVSISVKSDFDLYDNYLDHFDKKNVNHVYIKELNPILKNISFDKNKMYINKLNKIRKLLKNGVILPKKNNLKNFLVKE